MIAILQDLPSIELRRKRLGLTQSGLARASNVSQSLIAKIESGSIDPAYSRAKAIFDALDSFEVQSKPTAGQLMSGRVHSIPSTETVKTAAAFMRRHQISQLPVIDSGRLVGSLSEKTLIDLVVKDGGQDYSKLAGLRVRDIMDDAFPVVAPSTTITAIAELLKSSQAVLVRGQGDFLGIISKADLLKAMNA